MENDQLNTPFTKALMAGLFAGVASTIVCVVYNSIYREISSFQLTSIINVSTIIFMVPLLLLPVGFIYYALSRYKHANLWYTVLLVVLTLLFVWIDYHIQRSPDPVLNNEFRQLLLGIIIISGLAGLFVPYLVTHETGIL